MNDVVLAFGGCKVIEQGADRFPESILSSCRRLPEQSLELGEEVLDRVEIRGIGGQVKHTGPCRPDRLLDPGHLVNSQGVHRDHVARLQRRREHLLDVGAERRPVMGPSSTKGAMIPLARRPATTVAVFQWPKGAASTRRSPLGPQPERRTMFVDAPVSSRNTKRSASM